MSEDSDGVGESGNPAVRSVPVLQDAVPERANPMTDAPKPKTTSNLAVRLTTAAVVVPAILWMLLAGPRWAWDVFVLFVALPVGAHELFAMTMPGQRVLQAWGILASFVMGLLFYTVTTDAYRISAQPLFPFAVLTVVGGSLLVSLLRPLPSEQAGLRMAWLVAGPFYAGGLIASIASLHALPNGGSWVLLSMMLAWFADTAGYFAGRFLGGKVFGARKMSPNISPNKTWEGAVGGMVGALLGAMCAHFGYLPELSLSGGIGLGLVAGPLGICGDLVESLIKRSTGTKDSGWIVPGHGGMIDRIDALMFTATATLIYARVFMA
jgi:phosphatidate cytidylyltransferase